MKKEPDISSLNRKKFSQFLDRKRDQPIEDQRFEAGMLIAEIKMLNTDKAFSTLQNKINRQNKFRQRYNQFAKIAAILILSLLILTVWNLTRNNKYMGNSQLSYQEISSPRGIRSKIVLPDGSEVWLNAGSKIRYSTPFVRETRELNLVGEAFLEVAKDPASPFEVKFNNFSVRVLGTQFNVKAFPDDRQMEVVLKEGSIQLETGKRGFKKEAVLMKPGQQWIYNKSDHRASLRKVNADRYTAWHQNVLILDDTPMAEVAKQIERWYGVGVEVMDKELYKYKFTTVFDNEPLHVVLELLEMSSPIRINYISGKINKGTATAEKPIIQINSKE